MIEGGRSPQDLLASFNRALGGDDPRVIADLFTVDADLLFANRAPAAHASVDAFLGASGVSCLRRDADGEWRIRLVMNSHSHPMEPIP